MQGCWRRRRRRSRTGLTSALHALCLEARRTPPYLMHFTADFTSYSASSTAVRHEVQRRSHIAAMRREYTHILGPDVDADVIQPQLRDWHRPRKVTERTQSTFTRRDRYTDSSRQVLGLLCGSLCVDEMYIVLHGILTHRQLFYRARYDLPVLLGMRHPWDH